MSSRPNSSEALVDKMKRVTGNCLQSTGLCCFKLSENTQITLLEKKIGARQKQFGVEYLTLVEQKAPESQLKKCVKDALADINEIKDEINDHEEKIGDRTNEVQQKIKPAPVEPAAAVASAAAPTQRKNSANKRKPGNSSGSIGSGKNSSQRNSPNNPRSNSSGKMGPRSNSNGNMGNVRKTPNSANGGKNGKSKTPFVISNRNKAPKKKPQTAVNGSKNRKDASSSAGVPEEFKNADPTKWKCREYTFSGQAKFEAKGKEETVKGSQLSIAKGLQKFKANPGRYTAMAYQSDMKGWAEKDQQYIFLHRKETVNWKPQGVSPKGWMTVYVNEYERLVPFQDDILPKKYRDKWTDSMTFQGRKLHSARNKPIMPGRGMGHGDSPSLKIIGDVDPSDIFQGSVGDCWLLSGISAVAEFDGAIKRLFRKTPNLEKMPMDSYDNTTAIGNMYTVTLWDLATWKEVDILIDERLPAHYDGSGNLLAGKPSEDGELWACYLEKALAIHCGGWDKIVGGQCTHAWALLTGCKEQYSMSRNPATGKWRCFAKYNPKTNEWGKHANSPHDMPKTTWRVGWPEVGGGGKRDQELDDEEIFMCLYAWDQVNYIVGAGTSGKSDKHSTGGMVDNHAYSVIESVDNVAGTDIDLIKVRNPWGKGEIEDGEFDDDGPGWDKYPQIKKALKPVVADDGIFWVTKKEFFQFFETIYLSASNMTEFLED